MLDENYDEVVDQEDRPAPARAARRSDDRDMGGEDEREERGAGRRRYAVRRHVCTFCAEHVDYVDYKQADMLRRYLTDRGKIKARRKTGLCAKHQRRLATAIKRARHLALLPFTAPYSH